MSPPPEVLQPKTHGHSAARPILVVHLQSYIEQRDLGLSVASETLLSSVYLALTFFYQLPLFKVEHGNMRFKWRRISRPIRSPMPLGIMGLLNLSSSLSPRDASSMTGSAASSQSQTQRFSSSAMALLITPSRHLLVFVVILLAGFPNR